MNFHHDRNPTRFILPCGDFYVRSQAAIAFDPKRLAVNTKWQQIEIASHDRDERQSHAFSPFLHRNRLTFNPLNQRFHPIISDKQIPDIKRSMDVPDGCLRRRWLVPAPYIAIEQKAGPILHLAGRAGIGLAPPQGEIAFLPSHNPVISGMPTGHVLLGCRPAQASRSNPRQGWGSPHPAVSWCSRFFVLSLSSVHASRLTPANLPSSQSTCSGLNASYHTATGGEPVPTSRRPSPRR